jgi:hypothetical protein
MNQSASEADSLKQILALLGEEVRELGHLTEQLQTTLSPALLRIVDDTDCHKNVQLLDLVSQRLGGISAFVHSLAPLVPPSWQIDATLALRNVSLSDLARRLSGHPSAALEDQAGDLEMF